MLLIIVSTIVSVYIPVEGGTYVGEANGVKVTVTTEDNTFVNPVELNVAPIHEDDEEYARAEAELANVGHEYDGMIAFDIHFKDTVTNEEVEPLKSVTLRIEITDCEAAGIPRDLILDPIVAHIFDDGGAELVIDNKLSEPAPDDGAIVHGFETEVFSTYTITYRRTVNVHYVDTNGNSLTPTMEPNYTAATLKYLIYDVEGYEYDHTSLTRVNGTNISPLLRTDGQAASIFHWQDDREVQYCTGNGNNSWTNLANNSNVYVVYKKKTTPTQGGTVEVDPESETWPDEKPKFSKSSTNNGDGTNTIALQIRGAEKQVQEASKANVIVVFDVSGSMDEDLNGQDRLTRAKAAVNSMANTLLNKTDAQGNKLVKMALVSFSTDAQIINETDPFTDNYSTYYGRVNALTSGGGTNWEKALYLANRRISVDSDAATFVVFVTDGDPTFRLSRGNVTDASLDVYTANNSQYYRNNSVFGAGGSDAEGRNFDFAVDEVESIVGANKTFYAVGISSDVQKVQNLCTDAGVPASNAFLATDANALNAAIASIAESISSKLGYGDVAITDGITDLTNTDMEVLQSVDADSFRYYRYGGVGNKYGADYEHKQEWTTRVTDKCGAATYNEDTGAVEWHMGDDFQMEDGVTYVVTFRCWPSEDALELVAMLNNGEIFYSYEEYVAAGGTKTEEQAIADGDVLSPEEKSQIQEITAADHEHGIKGHYTLKTNTEELTATYKKTTASGDTVEISDPTPIEVDPGDISVTTEDMELDSMELKVFKTFEDDLTSGEDRETMVTVVLNRRQYTEDGHYAYLPFAFPHYNPVQTGTDEAGDPIFTDVYVNSPNIVLYEGNNWQSSLYVAPGVMVNPNHDAAWNAEGWERLEAGFEFTLTEPNIDYHYDLVPEDINPMIGNGTTMFVGDTDGNTALTGNNVVKSGIDITKVVVDKDGNEFVPDTEFTFRGQLLDEEGNPYLWAEGDDVDNSGAYHKYDKDGTRIVYKGHFPTTQEFEFTLKPGERIRFINVPDGTTWKFWEVTPNEDYEDDYGLAAVTQHRNGPGGEFVMDPEELQPRVEVVDNHKTAILDQGVVGNKQYSVKFTNTLVDYPSFYVYHSSDNTIEAVSIKDNRVTATIDEQSGETTYTFNIVNETKKGFHYAGYYKVYGGSTLTAQQINDLTYAEGNSETQYDGTHEGGQWVTDEDGTAYDGTALKCAATNTYFWKKANAYLINGEQAQVEPFAVYYLKEVPDIYLETNGRWIYDWANNNKILKMYFLTCIDDTYYSEVGYDVVTTENKATIVTTFSYQQRNDPTVNKVKAEDLIGQRGYIGVVDSSNYITSINSEGIVIKPYWHTLDGVKIGTAGYTLSKNGDGDLTKDNIVATPN